MSKSYIPVAWKEEIIKKQRSYCAGVDCAKLHHGKKMKVTVTSTFDHKKPEAMNGKNIKSNIQALCPNCHADKTRKDHVRIRKWKKKHGTITTHKATEELDKKEPKMVTITTLSGKKRRVPIEKTKVFTNLRGEKIRKLKEPWER